MEHNFRADPRHLLTTIRAAFLYIIMIMALVMVPIFTVTAGAGKLQGLASTLALTVLCLGWLDLQHTKTPDWVRDLLESSSLFIIMIGAGSPLRLTGLLYFAVQWRSLYGTHWAVARGFALYSAVFYGAVVFVHGSPFSWDLLTIAPQWAALAALMHILAVTFARLERAKARETVLKEASARLLSAATQEEVYSAAVQAGLQMLENRPDLRVMLAVGSDLEMTLVAGVGDGASHRIGGRFDMALFSAERRAQLLRGELIETTTDEASRVNQITPAPQKARFVLVPIQVQNKLHGLLTVAADRQAPEGCTQCLYSLGALITLALERDHLTSALHRQQSEARFRSLVQNASDAITVLGPDYKVSYTSPASIEVLGYPPEELNGIHLGELLHPEDLPKCLAALEAARADPGGHAMLACRGRHRDGAWRQVETTVTDLTADPNVGGIVLNTRDVTERKALEEQLLYQASHDPLTRLANRTLFRERVGQALGAVSSGGKVAVLFLDLDGFKTINDSFGHATGDRLLLAVARRLLSAAPPHESVARLGGDEFAVLMSETDLDRAAGAADRITKALRTPFALQGKDVHVHASIGVALSHSGQESADELLRNADVAMYRAKAGGKNRYALFEPGQHAALVKRMNLEVELRSALQSQELLLHFQPLVDLKTGLIVGLEALVRWHHPVLGIVPPGDFIPLAEETDLIVPLGDWVLREACREAVQWQQLAGRAVGISVNLSAKQIMQPDLVTDVGRALAATGLNPALLTLELTESVWMEGTRETIAALQELKQLGVRLALDDFGTGYSSLSYLRSFPLDVVKVDRSFVQGMSGQDGRDLVHAIVNLVGTLRLETVAEGIETAEQLALLASMGCQTGQGYLLSRPVPAGRVPAMLTDSVLTALAMPPG